jgi:hypothetical protein
MARSSALRQIGWLRIGPNKEFSARIRKRNWLTMYTLTNFDRVVNVLRKGFRTLGQVAESVPLGWDSVVKLQHACSAASIALPSLPCLLVGQGSIRQT